MIKVDVRTPLLLISCLYAAGYFLLSSASTNAQEDAWQSFLQPKPKLELVDVFESQRFPNVVVTPRGTVVLTWGSESIIAKRSTDGGARFGDPIPIAERGIQGGGLTVDSATGDLLTFVEAQHPPAEIELYRSRDDGQTWKLQETTIHPDREQRMPSMHMNEHGITLRHGPHAGRLIRASRYYAGKNDRSLWPEHFTNAIFDTPTDAAFAPFAWTPKAVAAE